MATSAGVPNATVAQFNRDILAILAAPDLQETWKSLALNIMGGTPVFVGTRVPVKTLFDYLEGGDSLEEFLDHFPSVHREQG